MNRTRHVAALLLAALAGIALAAAITLATSQLVRQHIGLASEPLGAGARLLPPSVRSSEERTPRPSPVGRPGTGAARRSPGPAVPPTRTVEPSATPAPSAPAAETPLPASQQPSSRAAGESGDASARRDD